MRTHSGTFDLKLTITIAQLVKYVTAQELQQLWGELPSEGYKHYPYLDRWYQSTQPTQCTHAQWPLAQVIRRGETVKSREKQHSKHTHTKPSRGAWGLGKDSP